MTAAMQNALLTVSTCFSLDPDEVFQAVLEAVIAVYGDTLAMVNLCQDGRVVFRSQRNIPPVLQAVGASSIPLLESY